MKNGKETPHTFDRRRLKVRKSLKKMEIKDIIRQNTQLSLYVIRRSKNISTIITFDDRSRDPGTYFTYGIKM